MKKHTAFICLFLALVIPFTLLAGCSRDDGLSELLNPSVPSDLPDTPETADPPTTGSTGLSEYNPGNFREAIDDNGFFKGVKALTCIEMFRYKGMEIPNNVHFISDEDVQSQIDAIVADFPSTSQITDRAIESGDRVNIDFIGSVDGVEFEGGNTEGNGMEVTAGSAEFIDDFLDQIIGHMPGETMNIEVTFPEDYGKEELNGKDALFITTLNFIAETEDAQLTDSFVAQNLSAFYGWTTVAEMKTGLRTEMQKYSLQQYIRDYFAKEITIKNMPDQMIDYQINSMMNYFQGYADYYGVSIEELLSSEGFNTVDDLINDQFQALMESASSTLVLLAIAEDAGFMVSDDDITDYFQKNNMTEDFDSILEEYGMPFIKHNVLCQKVLEYVIDNAILL